MNQYQDIEIICVCGKFFLWTAGEQKFLNDLVADGKIKSVIQSKHCAACRLKKKQEREQEKTQGYNYNY